MLKDMSELAPRAALLAGIAWGVAHYFVVGPEIAERVVRVDHLPACEASIKAGVIDDAEKRMAALPKPSFDPVKEMAADHLKRLRKSPFVEELERTGLGAALGIDIVMDVAGAQVAAQKQAAVEAYNRAVAAIEAAAATELANAGTVCGAVADAAIADTRMQWAVFSGTLGLIRPAPLRDFDGKMEQVRASGRFSSGGEIGL